MVKQSQLTSKSSTVRTVQQDPTAPAMASMSESSGASAFLCHVDMSPTRFWGRVSEESVTRRRGHQGWWARRGAPPHQHGLPRSLGVVEAR